MTQSGHGAIGFERARLDRPYGRVTPLIHSRDAGMSAVDMFYLGLVLAAFLGFAVALATGRAGQLVPTIGDVGF